VLGSLRLARLFLLLLVAVGADAVAANAQQCKQACKGDFKTKCEKACRDNAKKRADACIKEMCTLAVERCEQMCERKK
jgi:hypothetical protein